MSTIKKSFYSPLASFLRARYPTVRTTPNTSSTIINAKVEANVPPAKPVAAQEVDRGDADETATLRGSIRGKSQGSFGADDEETPVAAE